MHTKPASLEFFSATIEDLKIRVRCSAEDINRIPAHGPVVIVSNHPYGLADGLALGALVSRVRSDFRILSNALLDGIPQARGYMISVNPFGGPDAVRENYQGRAH